MHVEFTTEVQRRLLGGSLVLSASERAMVWRAQTGTWLRQEQYAPEPVRPLIREAVELIFQAAFLVEQGLEESPAFARTTDRLFAVSHQIGEWVP